MRNWCDVCVNVAPYAAPMSPLEAEYGGMRFVLRAEHPKRRMACAEETFVVEVPRFPGSVWSSDGGLISPSTDTTSGSTSTAAGGVNVTSKNDDGKKVMPAGERVVVGGDVHSTSTAAAPTVSVEAIGG